MVGTAANGLKVLPHWVAQPYFRPAPPEGHGVKKKKEGVREMATGERLATEVRSG